MKSAERIRTDERSPIGTATPPSRLRRLVVVLALVGFGAALGAGGALVGQNPGAAEEASSVAAQAVPGAGAETCTTYDLPSLVGPATVQSSLVRGSTYVLVCSDGAGREVVNETFVFQGAAAPIEGGVSLLPSP